MRTTHLSKEETTLEAVKAHLARECGGQIPLHVIHPSPSDLYDVVVGALPEREAADVRTHILACQSCKQSADALLVTLVEEGAWRSFGLAHLAVYDEEAPRAGKPFVWRSAADARVMATLLGRWFGKELSHSTGRDGAVAILDRALGALILETEAPRVFSQVQARPVIDRYLADELVRVRATSTNVLSEKERQAFRGRAGDPFLRVLAAGRVWRSWASSPEDRARARAVCGRPPAANDIESIREGCDQRVAALEQEMAAKIAPLANRTPTSEDGAKAWQLISGRDDLESVVVALAQIRSQLPRNAPATVERMLRITQHRLLSDLRAFDQALGPHLAVLAAQMRCAFLTDVDARVADQSSEHLAAVSVHGEDGYWFRTAIEVREIDAQQWLARTARPAAQEIVVNLENHPLSLCDHANGEVATTVSTFEHRGEQYSLKIASLTHARTRRLLLVLEKGERRLGDVTVALGGRPAGRVVRDTPAVAFQMADQAAGKFSLASRPVGLDLVARVSRTRLRNEATKDEVMRFLTEMVGEDGLDAAKAQILEPCARCRSLGGREGRRGAAAAVVRATARAPQGRRRK